MINLFTKIIDFMKNQIEYEIKQKHKNLILITLQIISHIKFYKNVLFYWDLLNAEKVSLVLKDGKYI